MDPKPLEDFLSQEEKYENQVMCVHVAATLPILQYTKRDGTKASMFSAAVADKKTAAKVLIYDVTKTTSIYESATILAMDFMSRDRYATIHTSVHMHIFAKIMVIKMYVIIELRCPKHQQNLYNIYKAKRLMSYMLLSTRPPIRMYFKVKSVAF